MLISLKRVYLFSSAAVQFLSLYLAVWKTHHFHSVLNSNPLNWKGLNSPYLLKTSSKNRLSFQSKGTLCTPRQTCWSQVSHWTRGEPLTPQNPLLHLSSVQLSMHLWKCLLSKYFPCPFTFFINLPTVFTGKPKNITMFLLKWQFQTNTLSFHFLPHYI